MILNIEKTWNLNIEKAITNSDIVEAKNKATDYTNVTKVTNDMESLTTSKVYRKQMSSLWQQQEIRLSWMTPYYV